MIASVSMAALLSRDGRSGWSARCTAQAISGRVTSWIDCSERCSISPRPRRSMANTPADRATAAGLRSRIAAASAMVTSRPSAKQSASSAGARSSGSASAVPSGTAARPNTSSTSTSSTAGHRDRAEGVALLHRRLTTYEHLEQRQEAGNGLESGAHAGEDLLELEWPEHEAIPEQPDLVLDGVGDRHRQRLGVSQALQHGAESGGEALRRDAQPFDRDDLCGHEPE